MTQVLPGRICPETGIWVPSNNPNFYPVEYTNRVMRRHFKAGDVMPATPHGEPSWSLWKQDANPLQDFSGLSPQEIAEKLNTNKKDGT